MRRKVNHVIDQEHDIYHRTGSHLARLHYEWNILGPVADRYREHRSVHHFIYHCNLYASDAADDQAAEVFQAAEQDES